MTYIDKIEVKGNTYTVYWDLDFFDKLLKKPEKNEYYLIKGDPVKAKSDDDFRFMNENGAIVERNSYLDDKLKNRLRLNLIKGR